MRGLAAVLLLASAAVVTYGVTWLYETADEPLEASGAPASDELLDDPPDEALGPPLDCMGGLWWGTAWGVGRGSLPAGRRVLTGRRGNG